MANNNNDNTAIKVRFVRCPKCLRLLAEFSHVPLYRCGSCGMVLKAKNNSPLGQNQNQNQNLVEESIDDSVELNDVAKIESVEIERVGVNGGIKAEEVIEDSRVNIGGSSEEDCNGGSGSFSSDNPSNGVPNKYRLMSKRTFRNGSIKDKGSISNVSVVRKINPSFDSEDFHSVQNLTEVNADKQPSVKCQKVGTSTEFNSLQFDHVELMKRVDEIRDKVDILIDKTVNKERKLSFRGDRKSKSLQQHVHCIHCPPREVKHSCSHHHLNACCHHSEKPNSRQHKTERKEEDDYHKNLNLKQKKPANSKVYCLPVQKGAPFVICSECMNVLHLPPDFLVSKKQWHKLQCGACSKILVFTFRARAHEGSSSAAEGRHPPTEASASNSNVSYTEEYQQFFLDKSYSLETQQFLCMPRDSPEINVERRCSSLHQLMGYDSASELLRLRSYSSDD